MNTHLWLAFVGASCAISLSPGAGAVLSMSTGLQYGVRYGFWNILGLQIGLLLQIIIVAAGIGTLLAHSAAAFSAIKWCGVGYLLFLAIRQWRALPTTVSVIAELNKNRIALIMKGFLANATNPKAVVFMLAILPQFLDATAPLVPQYLVIVPTMICVDALVMTAYTTLAARVFRLLKSPQHQRIINRTFAGLFVAAASALSLIQRTASP
ncbi:MAG: LysE family transporter [Mycobacteriaceae bacterium]